MRSRTNRNCAVLAVLLGLAACAWTAWGAPATQPAPGSIYAFFQPARNVAPLVAIGVNTFTGPSVENSSALTPAALAAGNAAWIQATIDNHTSNVLKNPPAVLPPNCVGVMMKIDEANGKGILPASMMAESQDLRARYPNATIYLSLAGDKILSANFDKPAEAQLYRDYAALCDIITIDFYSRNRNATRYPDTYPGDCVKKLAALTGKPVIPWLEMNDQQLAPPPTGQGINRAPTPGEIQAQFDWCIKQGAAGIGWFATCDSGKYGWTSVAGKGDSFWPLIDRASASIQPQIDKVKAINIAYGKSPTPAPVISPDILALRAQVAQLKADIDANLAVHEAAIGALGTRTAAVEAATKPDAILSMIVDKLRPKATTQPGGMP